MVPGSFDLARVVCQGSFTFVGGLSTMGVASRAFYDTGQAAPLEVGEFWAVVTCIITELGT